MTDAETVDIVRMALAGKVNREIVAAVNRHGSYAVGLSGEDAGLIRVDQRDPRPADRHHELGIGGDVEGPAVENFVLEEHDRIGIANGALQQAFEVACGIGHYDLEAGHGHRPVLHGLRVLRAETRARAVAGLDDERQLDLAVRHVAGLRDLVRDDVPAHGEEVGEHDLGDRAQARHRGAHGGAQDRLLGDGRVLHALAAELVEEPDGGLEHATGSGDVLAQEHDVGITAHFLRHAGRDGLTIS